MSKNNTEKPTAQKGSSAPTAASASYSNEFAMRAPPPTYEESQRMQGTYAATSIQQHATQPPLYPPIAGNQYYGMTHHEQLPRAIQMQGLHRTAPNYGSYNFQQQVPSSSGVHQLTLDPRAEIRTTATGAIVVPPPPPGCAPTPAQLAAMQGQPVVVKQKKRSFF